MADGRLFSDTLQTRCNQFYGTAGIAYLEQLVDDNQDFGAVLEEALKLLVVDEMESQEMRAARAFALVALAGELATDYGLTGWTKGAALDAVNICFARWREHRGKGTSEDKAILESIRNFVDRYGDSRFSNKSEPDQSVKTERSGWYSDLTYDERTFLFTAAGMADAATGFDNKRVIEALTKAGWLHRANDGKAQKSVKIGGRTHKLYEVTIL